MWLLSYQWPKPPSTHDGNRDAEQNAPKGFFTASCLVQSLSQKLHRQRNQAEGCQNWSPPDHGNEKQSVGLSPDNLLASLRVDQNL